MKLPSEKLNAKIIALDLDDTLLTKNLTISDFTIKTLRKVAEKGIYIVLCSGRAENAILPYVRALSIAGTQQGRFLIALNGASIYDLHIRNQIYCQNVETRILQFVYKNAISRDFSTQVYDASTIYASADTVWTQKDKMLSGLNFKIQENYFDFLEQGFSKIVVSGEPEKLKKFEKFLNIKIGKTAEIFISKPYFLEVMPKDCGKGQSLLWLANHVGIAREETMAFGDSFNDMSMIQLAQFGVAMNNALPEIKTAAKYITRMDNEHDGIADFLEEFVL